MRAYGKANARKGLKRRHRYTVAPQAKLCRSVVNSAYWGSRSAADHAKQIRQRELIAQSPNWSRQMEAVFSLIFIFIFFVLPIIMKYYQKKREEEARRGRGQQPPGERETSRPYQRPVPEAGETESDDPFEIIRRRIEMAQRRREEESRRQPTPAQPQAQRPQAPRPRPQPQPQYTPPPRPQPQYAPQPKPQQRRQPERTPQVVPRSLNYDEPEETRKLLTMKGGDRRDSGIRAAERSRRRNASGARRPQKARTSLYTGARGWKKIESLPKLKQAIVLSELLGAPRGLSEVQKKDREWFV